jgi:hypothetical protein
VRFRTHTKFPFSTTPTSKNLRSFSATNTIISLFQHSTNTDHVLLPPISTSPSPSHAPFTFKSTEIPASYQYLSQLSPEPTNIQHLMCSFSLMEEGLHNKGRQLAELKALEEETYRQIDDAHKTAGLQCALFVLRAEVHKISVALEQITQDPCPELLTLMVREPAAKSSPDFPPIDLCVHARYIACNSNTTYLELESRPSTPFSLSLTPSLMPSTAPSSRPTTPPLMVKISTHFPIDETATLYHGQIKDVTNSCYHGGWCHRALHNSLKTRRPGGRLRIRR